MKALGSCDLCATTETLAELERVLDRDRFDRYLDWESRRAFAALIRRNAHLITTLNVAASDLQPPCRDPADTQFLALALAAGAYAIVSSDQDLLVLHPWRGIEILKPAEFLASALGFSMPAP
jgi:putative PIN family toxin of toxin-antitoxin system